MCGTLNFRPICAWQPRQSSFPGARVRWPLPEACGSWQAMQSPAFTGACWTLPPPSSEAASWQLAQSAPPFAWTAKGFGLVGGAWQESQPPPETGAWSDALSSLAPSEECGSWHALQALGG